MTTNGLAGFLPSSLSAVRPGMVLEAGSRLKIEAARDRARVNARVRKWSLKAVMVS